MDPIQNMEAMFQIWKNIVFRNDLHLGPIGSFYCECTLIFINQEISSFFMFSIF
jgi:hypothetical protein